MKSVAQRLQNRRTARRTASLMGLCAVVGCGYVGVELDDDDAVTATGGSRPGDGDGDPSGGAESGDGGASANSGGLGGLGGMPPSGGADTDGGDTGGAATGGSDTGGASTGGTGTGGAGTSTGGAGTGGDGTGGLPAECGGLDEAVDGLIGWAQVDGQTTGGQNGTQVVVSTGAQIIQALESKSPFTPLTIRINQAITPQNTGADKIDIKGVRDVSILGVGQGAEFRGIGLKIWQSGNIVLRNLRIHHVDQGEKDAISIAGPADHIWIDHCDLYSEYESVPKETYDGLIDIKDDAEYITISWNHMYDSWWFSLAGESDLDVFDRKITFHHNLLENGYSGTPSIRSGDAHLFNNYFRDIDETGVNSRVNACVRLEGNVFENVRNPWVSAYSTQIGGVEQSCNIRVSSEFDTAPADIREADECELVVPYDYSPVYNNPRHVAAIVEANAGSGVIGLPQNWMSW